MWRIGFTQGSAWVETVCPEPEELDEDSEPPAGRWMDLGISLSKPVAATARGSTLMIYYVPAGQSERYVLEIPFGVVLCEGEVADEETGVEHPECDYLHDDYYGR